MDRTDAENAFRHIAATLERWAAQSKAGGWSTHQIEPQRSLAKAIYEALGAGDLRRIVEWREL